MPEVVINNFPSTISSESFDISVTIKGAKSGTNYLRAEIYKDNTKNYFGETFNGKDWIKSSNGKDYFPVEIKSSSTSASFKARIGNPDEKDYPSTGEYKLKIIRYTSSGNLAGDSELPVNIQINYNLQIPTPTLTPTVTPLDSPVVTITETPVPISTKIPQKTLSTQVLADETEVPVPQATLIVKSEISNNHQFSIIPAVVFFVGLLFVGISFYPIVRKKIKEYNERHAP